MNIQEMIKDTYSNLKFYVRDVDIEDKIIYKYKIGDIIYEKAFVDCTKKISGLSKKVRYFILSNKAKDLSKYETLALPSLRSEYSGICSIGPGRSKANKSTTSLKTEGLT